jgi:formamidopyrimidine-DNA glycosylase
MPELPEVENLRIGLEKYISGQKITKVKITKPKLVFGHGTIRKASVKKVEEFISSVQGEKFIKVERRAKNIIFKLTNNKIILTHLKMTGQFVYKSKNKKEKVVGGHPIEISEKTLPNKHTHIIFELEKGFLYYNDTRMFGYVLYYKDSSTLEKLKHIKDLGVEPLSKDFTLKYFIESLKNKKGKIKSILMGQDVVVGIGNIYTDESLFEARIHPERPANTLNKEEITKLYKAIKRILDRAIKVGGSSVATYRLIDESVGNYAREHKVYGKAGKNCINCKTKLEKILVQNRTTVFCKKCQK